MKASKAIVAGWVVLAFFAAGISTQAATIWKGTVDDNWSTAGNWLGGVPGSPDVLAQIDGTDSGGLINVDVATTGMRTLQYMVNAKQFAISGQTLNFDDGVENAILHSGSNDQTINNNINITSGTSTIRAFRNAMGGHLIINGNVTQNANTFRLNGGKVTLNGTFTGDTMRLTGGLHTFANTDDNDFNSLVFATASEAVVNTAANTLFFDGSQILFNSTDSKMTLNNANVLGDSTGLTIGNAANTATLAFNADETLGTVRAVGTFDIDLGAGVNHLAFANSSGLTWTGGLVINDFRPGVVRFGINGSGLTDTQLGLIAAFAPGGEATGGLTLDGNGYLIPEPASLGLIAIGSTLFLAARRLVAM